MIWPLSLEPRVIEIEFNPDKGFFSRHFIPPALHTCQDSRNAVIASYTLCFGSIYHPASILFNFSIDTLYLGPGLDPITNPEAIPLLFSTFKDGEVSQLQWLAADANLFGQPGPGLELCTKFGDAVERLAGMKEFTVAYDINRFL